MHLYSINLLTEYDLFGQFYILIPKSLYILINISNPSLNTYPSSVCSLKEKLFHTFHL
jgi:hypothetical protein